MYLNVPLFRMHVEIQCRERIWCCNTDITAAHSSSKIQENRNRQKLYF